jgi:YD repeat-containing protein
MPGRFKKTDLSYDKAGRPKTEQTYQNGTLAMTLTTSYGLDGQPTTVGDGSDSLTSVYDPYGRLDQTKRGSTVLTDYAYNPDGTIASRVDGSLAATSFGYDWAKRPISTTLSPTIYAGSPLTATFRLDGLVDKVTLPSGPQSSTLGYDAARRPISLTLQSGGSLSQAYDRAGNRLTKIEGSTTFTYQYRRTGGISHVQETGQGSQFFVHDAYGNLTADSQSGVSTTSYTYDARNELVAITPPSGPVATFTRDALGRLKERTLTTSPTATTDTYGYVGTSEAVFEIVTSGGSSSTTRGPSGSMAQGSRSGPPPPASPWPTSMAASPGSSPPPPPASPTPTASRILESLGPR